MTRVPVRRVSALTLCALVAGAVSGCLDLAMPPPDVARGDPAWSPDGKSIAFTFSTTPWGDDDIHIVAADGEDDRQLTSDYESRSPSWSPDGKRIAFAHGDGALREIYVMDADGSHRRNLTRRFDRLAIDPAWSPDGKLIAFVAGDVGFESSDVYVMDADGTDRRRVVTPPGAAYDPVWSPDGARIAYDVRAGGRTNVHVVGRDGRGNRLLVSDAHSPAWSPTGATIAFVRGLTEGSGDFARFSSSICTVSSAGSGLRCLREDVGLANGLAWSPDGRDLAFALNGDLYEMDADGSKMRRL